MKDVHCNIVKDLMINYIDKVSSEETNELVESHIKTCKECNETLKQMTKDVGFEPLIKQDEEIDYLKRYRKKSIATIIATIIVTILVICNCILFVLAFLFNTEFSVDVQDIIVTCMNEEEDNTFLFKLYELNGMPKLICDTYEVVEENTGLKSLHIKIVGKFTLGQVVGGATYVEIDETINKVYLEDKKGIRREIWNKEDGLQLKTEIYHY